MLFALLDWGVAALWRAALSAGPGGPPPPPWWSLSSSLLPRSSSSCGRAGRSQSLQMHLRGVDECPSHLSQQGSPHNVHGVVAARKFLQNMHSPLPASSRLLPKVRLQKVHLLPSVSKSVTISLVMVQIVSQPRQGFCTCLYLVRACCTGLLTGFPGRASCAGSLLVAGAEQTLPLRACKL